MKIVFSTESVEQVWADIQPLLQAHWEEIALYKDKVPLAPDYDLYRKMEGRGALLICMARYEDKIVGYGVYFVHRGMHYMKTLVATNDVIYIEPAERGDSLGAIENELLASEFIRFAEFKLKMRGVSVINYRIKVDKDWSGLAESEGYPRVEYIHQKYLGERNGV
jgi:hypothetical protein